MKSIPASSVPAELFPMWGEGLGVGAHKWARGKQGGLWVGLCGATTPTFAIGIRFGVDLCPKCVEAETLLMERDRIDARLAAIAGKDDPDG